MRTIFLNRYFHPDHSATSQMLSELAFALAGDGRPIVVVTSRMRYDDPATSLPARETVGGVEIYRVWTSRFGRSNLLGRAVDYLTFYLSAAVTLWRLARAGDAVVAMTDPPVLSCVAAPIALARGARLVNWLQDVFPEVAEGVGLGGRRIPAFVYAALRKARDWSLRAAAMNVAIGERMAEKVAAASDRVTVIPNWADGDLVCPVAPQDNALRREWGLDGHFVVGYSGNLGRAHDFAAFLDAIERLEKTPEAANVRWLFIGAGALQGEFRRALDHAVFRRNRLNAENAIDSENVARALSEKPVPTFSQHALTARGPRSVVFKPYQPRERLAESLSAADVHIVSLKPEMEGLIVPSKFYGVAAAGRPAIFVGDADGEIARIVTRHDIGGVAAQGDGAALAAEISALVASPEICREKGARARALFEKEFERRIAVERWERLLASLAT